MVMDEFTPNERFVAFTRSKTDFDTSHNILHMFASGLTVYELLISFVDTEKLPV